jgi:uncharacterized protein YnzC (UPF0291/DUF896 family)
MDGSGYTNIDLTWIPKIDGKKVHAVQWFDGEGEIEFVGPDQNLKINELGAFEKAVDLWNERKEEEDILRQQQLEDEERRRKQEEERVKSQFLSFDEDELGLDIDNFDDLVDGIPKAYIPPTSTHMPPVEPLMSTEKVEEDEEDEDLFYDIEELLKEI